MKRPEGINSLTLAGKELGSGGAYPPLGFKPVWDAELGNGDYYGLYWPFGREDQDPVVCDMIHDQSGLQVSFSSVPIFVKWLELNNGQRGDIDVDDPKLVTSRYESAKTLFQSRPDEAIDALRNICRDFPEHSEYWFALAGQLRRVGDHVGAAKSAIHSFASNWAFGMPHIGIVRLLQSARNIPSVADDPLVIRSSEIVFNFGGRKENPIYGLLTDCIARYLESSNPLPGILLNQNYGYMMMAETKSFQERNGFVAQDWLAHQSGLCETHLGDNRESID